MSNHLALDEFLLPYQRRFADASQKKKLWLSARQIGKSFDLAYLAARAVLTSRKGGQALALCISTGARAASELLKKVAQMAEAIHIIDPSIAYSCSMDKVQFSNGARVISLPSGNPVGLRGYTADIVIIDEAAYIDNPEEVWAAIAPTLTRDPDAELILASTPAGKASWFYKLYEDAIQDNSWYVQTTTIEDAVKQGLQVDLEQLKSTIKDPDVWDREYMCQFAQEYSSLVDISILDFIDPPSSDILDIAPHFLGMDIGSTSDKTAIADIVELPDHTLLVSDIVLLHKASYEHQLEILKEKHDKVHYKAGYIDQNGIGSALAEFATKQVSTLIKGYTWTGSNKTPAYENLRAKIFDHKLKFASHLKPLITQDFQNVHRVVNEAGNVKYEAGRDSNGHSDSTSAIVLGLEAAREHPTQMQMPKADAIRSVFGPMPFGGSRLFR